MPLKQVVFLLGSLMAIPAGVVFTTMWPGADKFLLALLLLTNTMDIDITIMNQALYRGTTLGFEIGAQDILAIVLFIARFVSPRWQGRRPMAAPLGTGLIVLYFATALPGVFFGPKKVYVLFEYWKFVRGFLVFWVVANTISEEKDIKVVVYAILLSTLMASLKMIYQRYGLGIHRVAGYMGHPNVSAMFLYMNIAFIAAWLLDGEVDIGIRWGVVLGLGTVGIMLTLSRGAIVMVPVIVLALITLSTVHALLPRRPGVPANFRQLGRIAGIIGLGLLGSLPILWKSSDTLYKRFVKGNEKGTQGRMDKNAAAIHMANEKPLGVGVNRFSLFATAPYKYAENYEREMPPGMHYRAPVHNIYLLIASEQGYYAIAPFVLLLIVSMRRALHEARRSHTKETRALAGGILACILSVTVHGILEYQVRVANLWILFFFALGALPAVRRMNEAAERAEEADQAQPQDYTEESTYANGWDGAQDAAGGTG